MKKLIAIAALSAALIVPATGANAGLLSMLSANKDIKKWCSGITPQNIHKIPQAQINMCLAAKQRAAGARANFGRALRDMGNTMQQLDGGTRLPFSRTTRCNSFAGTVTCTHY